MPKPTDHESALKRAVFWINVLLQSEDIDPAETDVAVKVRGVKKGETESTVLADETLNLGEDLAAFAELGADSDFWSDVERQEG